ncbi:MAG: acyl-CoA synthetase [Cytophagales bacterium]|nr:acyl-CoA synthetase [Bernardetiaceae bacterium]MDW8203835.1 acyl-CoA synthetase [Cytophagales bacterium]
MLSLPFFSQLRQFAERQALSDTNGTYTYAQLIQAADTVSSRLGDVASQPICFLYPSSFDYAAVLFGIWQSGGIAVPLCVTHPPAEWAYVLSDTGCAQVWVHPQYEAGIREAVAMLPHPSEIVVQADFGGLLPSVGTLTTASEIYLVNEQAPALMIYTSGTTGKPKGAVHTHASIAAQIQSLSDAWAWQADDEILNILPLHHVHGLINILCCALWNGAHCLLRNKFDAAEVWEWFKRPSATLFMAVPTVYQRLIQHWEQAPKNVQAEYSAAARKLRLMVSGSAALPVPVLQRWQAITGHFLLERYGMTEIGMAISNPLIGERKAGFVGKPLPGVSVRLVNENGEVQTAAEAMGEIQVKSPTLFRAYWQRPEATAQSFTPDGWFCTGDMAQRDAEGNYKIMGRLSADILKISGYKVSALEIEDTLLAHPAVQACAVVGIPHAEKGEQAAAFLVLSDDAVLPAVQQWLKTQLAPYKQPTQWLVVNELPRNAMGKVQKSVLKMRIAN